MKRRKGMFIMKTSTRNDEPITPVRHPLTWALAGVLGILALGHSSPLQAESYEWTSTAAACRATDRSAVRYSSEGSVGRRSGSDSFLSCALQQSCSNLEKLDLTVLAWDDDPEDGVSCTAQLINSDLSSIRASVTDALPDAHTGQGELHLQVSNPSGSVYETLTCWLTRSGRSYIYHWYHRDVCQD